MDVPVTTRPVQPDDGPRFCRLWNRLSAETVYRRFHAPLRSPPVGARRFVEVDHDLREALVAADPSTADVAVVVEDGWQGVGVGRQLLGELTQLAGRRGVRTLTADVQADNDRVLGLVRRLLPGASLRPEAGVYAVASPLPSAPAPAAA
jgi:GNAT superfamily N-acetyltransferase